MSDNIVQRVYQARLTRFELARIVGARALQLAHGAPPLIDVSNLPYKDPVAIAIIELLKGLLPMSVKRRKSDGSFELVPVSRLLSGDNKRYLESILDSWGKDRRY
ncbi:DNA-directed RNA polymerase subunit K [Thermogladius sp. 4427co]|uniref:DNA-directed RNA polymerase subunit K n=1 Tax=Thermogladius sp. 4427co TaxID=3450718 RepID=UPI003F7A6035